MALKREEVTEDRDMHEFTLNQEEKQNFIKMLRPFNFDEIAWSESMGFSDTNKCVCFGTIRKKVFQEGTPNEKTERYSDMEAVKNWRNLMNSKGWTWVNDSVEDLAKVDRITPMGLVKYIKNIYNIEPEYRPYVKYSPDIYKLSNKMKVNN